eukprot:SAG31_NODE_653_length_13152_cov_4.899487_6_plen_80_part_00
MEKELEEPGGLDGVINECLLLADAGKHDNIVRLYDVYKSETEYALIMGPTCMLTYANRSRDSTAECFRFACRVRRADGA